MNNAKSKDFKARSNKYSIDINCDLGEGETELDCLQDARLMPFISTCNIACGGHAGNELTMTLAIYHGIKHQLKLGAHPGYEDKNNFGRRTVKMSKTELLNSLKKQIDKLSNLANIHGAQLHHVKFHGALYNDIEANEDLALTVANFCAEHYPHLKLMGLVSGNLALASNALGLDFISEAFMDRAYLSNGQLSPRRQNGSLLKDPADVVEQALEIISKHRVSTIDQKSIQKTIALKADSICLHGDNPQALTIAKTLYQRLTRLGFKIKSTS